MTKSNADEPELLDGPRRGPKSGKDAKQLVVLLHGYGANGRDLIGLYSHLSETLPDALFIAPDAPEPLPFEAFDGFQWFPLEVRTPEAIAAGAFDAAPKLNAFLDHELSDLGLDDGALALVGFSQGTMMALHVGLRRETAPAALVGFSGALPAADRLAADIRSHPPTLLIHGERDDVVPADGSRIAAAQLEELEVPVATVFRPRLDHAIDQKGIQHASAFLKAAFTVTDEPDP